MEINMSGTFTRYATSFTQYIKVREFEPFANFWAISASTVSSGFSATDASIAGQLTNISNVHNGSITVDGATYPFISGYAPNLTVYFRDSSIAHTFPIGSYQWNFGDPFNEGPEDATQTNSNYYTVNNVITLSGNFNDDPVCWKTNKQAHTAVHTYIMPGTYDVTLTVAASNTNTTDICARYADSVGGTGIFYIYVKEIPPRCNGGIFGSLNSTSGFTTAVSGVSGTSPVTAYFMASGIIAGSFPICRMDWDFGDGTIQKITRYPYTQTTTQGLSVINVSAYAYDVNDPRNIIVPHIYTNTTGINQSFNVNISAYACNTNTMIRCSAQSLVSPIISEIEVPIVDTKKLIGSRFDDKGNLIFIMEGQNENTTYTIAMTGELL